MKWDYGLGDAYITVLNPVNFQFCKHLYISIYINVTTP